MDAIQSALVAGTRSLGPVIFARDLFAKLDAIRSALAELQQLRAQNAALADQVQELENESAIHRAALNKLLPCPDPMTEEEIKDIEVNGIPFEDVIAELRGERVV